MYCSTLQLVKQHSQGECVIVLPCRSWNCEECAQQRRRNLVYDAASGDPTALLTLTVNPSIGISPVDRARKLRDAFIKLRKLIVYELKKPPALRWNLQVHTRKPEKERQVREASNRTAEKAKPDFDWFGFVERTKRGEPHFHILLRSGFIPQDWISEQMQRLVASPIVWIERIKNTSHAVWYVTKYVGKAPAKFGNLKRYWKSKRWLQASREKRQLDWKRGDYIARRTSWRDLIQQRVVENWSWYVDDSEVWWFIKPEFSQGLVGWRQPPPRPATATSPPSPAKTRA